MDCSAIDEVCVYLLTFLIFVGILIGEHDGLPTGSHWLTYLYASVLLAVCLVVCLTGSTMFARISIVILCVSLSAERKLILHEYSSIRQCIFFNFDRLLAGVFFFQKNTVNIIFTS